MGSVAALDHSLNPFGKWVPLVGVGGRTQMLGYVLIRVQVEGVPGYGEDQVAFIVDDPETSFTIPSADCAQYPHHKQGYSHHERIGNA